MEGSKLRPLSPGSGVSFSVSSAEQHEKNGTCSVLPQLGSKPGYTNKYGAI